MEHLSLTKTFCHQTDLFLSQMLKSCTFVNISVCLWAFRWQKPTSIKVMFLLSKGFQRWWTSYKVTPVCGLACVCMPRLQISASVSTNLMSETTFQARISKWQTINQTASQPQPLSHYHIWSSEIIQHSPVGSWCQIADWKIWQKSWGFFFSSADRPKVYLNVMQSDRAD